MLLSLPLRTLSKHSRDSEGIFFIPCYMATFARSAPLPEGNILVEGAQFQEIVQRSRTLLQKILLSIPDTHKSCIHTETLQLNSSENAKLVMMASTIGIPSAPVVTVVSENLTLETSLTRMSEGLQLHRALLSSVSPRLENKDKVTVLQADIRDLVIQINKMLKMIQAEAVVQPSPTPVALRLPGEYEVQVAAHLTLVQLQSFGQDTARFLRSLDHSNEDTES
ncbi:colony stimulating factor 3 (granulocyte) a isoform X1 [Perca fluviatilis]|nr:colony stimulating factor 3 (granulocyte) a isoform X1 [Perca fluviatilis]